MMSMNWLALFVAALVPLVVGMVWYNEKVFGTAWMQATGMTREKAAGANMPLIFGLTFLFSFMIAFAMQSVVIHQYGIYSTLANEVDMKDPNSELSQWVNDFMAKYGQNFRTFKHGMLHGFILGLFIALPIIGINALFERRSAKYIFINAGYWTLCLMLMGGIISGWV